MKKNRIQVLILVQKLKLFKYLRSIECKKKTTTTKKNVKEAKIVGDFIKSLSPSPTLLS